MTKPFSPSELVARVKAHLSRYERLIGSNVEENDVIEEIRGAEDRHNRKTRIGTMEKSVPLRQKSLIF